MEKALSLFCLSFLLFGCGGGGGGGGGAGSPISQEPQGRFISEGTISLSKLGDYNTHGCKTQGSDESDGKLDPRLKSGMSFIQRFSMWDNSGKSFSAKLNTVISSVTANSFSKSETPLELTGISGITAGSTYVSKCEVTQKNGVSSLNCANPIAGTPDEAKFDASIPKNCYPSGGNGSERSVTAGTFELAQGGRFKAYRVSGSITGAEIFCDGKSRGKGSSSYVVIKSNEVPAMDINYCGGTMLFLYDHVTLDNGGDVSAVAVEFLSHK